MSRYGPNFRSSTGDLAYGGEPQRWDRERFERFGRAPLSAKSSVSANATDQAAPISGSKTALREEIWPPALRPRRTDRELFGEDDPRELADRALAPYRRKSIIERDIALRETRPSRPGMLRRQSSLDTFDRRPLPRYSDRDDYRMPANVPIPLPRRRSPSRRRYTEDDFEEIRYRDASPEGYREVEIKRETESVSTRRSSSSSSSSSFEEVSTRASSPSPERKAGKKGKTRMPKRLVKKQAIIELGYPFEEEEDFIIVRRALEKEQIDEVIARSEQYKESNVTTYRYEENVSAPAPLPPPNNEHYEALRTEWINPPSIRAPSVRAPSPTPTVKTSRTRRSSPARTVRAPSPVRREEVIIQERVPAPPAPPAAPLTIVLPERRERSERDLKAEIRALEAEQRALRLEREADQRREMALRIREEPAGYEVVEYREERPRRSEIVEYVERPRSPPRNVVRIEKDRKGRMALVRSAH
ncbi:hypothetical protein H2203_001005 [Taxawa tesnikishii (nom. ined.)]|nr:hypothetical protein H2203_001005 [Dothideales sp. JES 119]